MKSAAFVFAVFLAFVAWSAVPVSLAGDSRNVNSINGSVKAAPGETYDTVSTVNGDVRVSRGATVDTAKTVNGEVVLESESKVGSVTTVNGSLEIGDGVTVTHDASTVNGELKIGPHTKVGGEVSTVSGEIELSGAEVGGSVTTVNGDIDLADGAHVSGNLVVKHSNNNWNLTKDDPKPVKVHICATCVVDGELRFERAVELRIDNGAKTGKVIGDKVTRR